MAAVAVTVSTSHNLHSSLETYKVDRV
jgi:hypothetical protein